MYTIKKLTKKVWVTKICTLKKRYEEHSFKGKIAHLKKPVETNTVYCAGCGNSLECEIGKSVVMSHRTPYSKWWHITCAQSKNLI